MESKRSRLRSPSDGFCVLSDYRGTRLFNNLPARSRSKGKPGCRDIGRARVSAPAPRPSRKPREYSRFYVRKRETPSLLSSRTLTQGQGDSKTRRWHLEGASVKVNDLSERGTKMKRKKRSHAYVRLGLRTRIRPEPWLSRIYWQVRRGSSAQGPSPSIGPLLVFRISAPASFIRTNDLRETREHAVARRSWT